MGTPYDSQDPHEVLATGVRRFVEFCTADVARYQLLFQRTIPGFEPSPESYAHAVEALKSTRQRLASLGIRNARHLDIWTALVTGLVDQQISNDPGGQRWIRLIDDFVEMFLAYCQQPRRPARPLHRSPPRKGNARGVTK
jgi:hypothetical protein